MTRDEFMKVVRAMYALKLDQQPNAQQAIDLYSETSRKLKDAEDTKGTSLQAVVDEMLPQWEAFLTAEELEAIG